LRADGYADNTVKAYQNAVRSLAGWLAEHHPEVGPAELDRQHIRGWLVEVRERRSSNTARGWFAGVRHFCRLAAGRGRGRPRRHRGHPDAGAGCSGDGSAEVAAELRTSHPRMDSAVSSPLGHPSIGRWSPATCRSVQGPRHAPAARHGAGSRRPAHRTGRRPT
jgi:hypothetical protein